MTRNLSVLTAAAAGLMLVASPSFAKEKADTGNAARSGVADALTCKPARLSPHSSLRIAQQALPQPPDPKSIDWSFLSHYEKDENLKSLAKNAYYMIKVAEAVFEAMLEQIRAQFGTHPNWAAYEARVRSDLAKSTALLPKIESGQATVNDLALHFALSSMGNKGLAIGILTQGSARECFGVTMTSAH